MELKRYRLRVAVLLLTAGLIAGVWVAPVSAQSTENCYCVNHPDYTYSECISTGHEWFCYPVSSPVTETTSSSSTDAAHEAHLYWYYNYGPGATQEAPAEVCCGEDIKKHEAYVSRMGTTQAIQDRNRDTGLKFARNTSYQATGAFTGGPEAIHASVPGASVDSSKTAAVRTPGSFRISGLAAGEGGAKMGLWFNPSYSWIESERPDSAYDGNAGLVMGGLDFLITPRFLIGVSLGYEKSDLDTTYNGGTFTSSGFSAGPYLAIQLADSLSLDAMFSWTKLDNDLERTTSLGNVSADYNSERLMAAVNLSWFQLVQNWNLSANVGAIYTDEDEDQYTETGDFTNEVGDGSVHLGEFRAGARVGYFIGSAEPYLSLAYLNDYSRSNDTGDEDEMEGILGVNYFVSSQVNCGMEVRNSFFRSDFTNTELMVNLRYAF